MMLILFLFLVLLLCTGGHWGYRRWGWSGGVGTFGILLAILLTLWILGLFGPGPANFRIR